MQFSTTEEHVRLVERAKALLARESPAVSLGELHQQALQLLVERLEKEKFAAKGRSPKAKRQAPAGHTEPPKAKRQAPAGQTEPPEPAHFDMREVAPRRRESVDAAEEATGAPRQRGGETHPTKTAPRQRGGETHPTKTAPRQRGGDDSTGATTRATRQRGRRIPAAIKREVFTRDAGCCSYVDERGQRCGETRYLELHHLKPFARGGPHVASNLALRCAAHNALAAEADFGRATMEQRRDATRHASLSAALTTEGRPTAR